MVDAASRGALMNKTLEEAWELMEAMADNNQHFKVRATSAAKGIYEVTPSESTILAKSLVDIAAISHYTDECPQLQKDNVIASSHNYYEDQTIPSQNHQYHQQTQGWRDNQQSRWNPNQPPQYRQPYNNNPPQNPQGPRYQPPYIR
ncbi:hypothetical protein PIB30_062433 [Stylosanthes scabra]|uniref:Uncharacterized protein n=1 Tax=Stylosanthes scabra TaxID=79078 RepID=A0ABU6YJS4_9FABA|nr:hypothetical protein [Stylosanthes scabra]